MTNRSSILIANLGSKAQIITLALDCLIEQGIRPERVVVVHTRSDRHETQRALERLDDDFTRTFPDILLDHLELARAGMPIEDVTSPEEVDVAFRAMYAEVRRAKLQDQQVHMLIAGGRRTLTVFGMAVAQMLFDDEDHLWHLASHPALEEAARLHATPGEWARLIAIPVIPWGRISPAFDSLRAVDDPFEAARHLHELRLREHWDSARIFVLTKISPAERGVVELLVRDGLGQQEIADRLSISVRTVEAHLRTIYRKAAEHWNLPDVNRTHLTRLAILFWRA